MITTLSLFPFFINIDLQQDGVFIVQLEYCHCKDTLPGHDRRPVIIIVDLLLSLLLSGA